MTPTCGWWNDSMSDEIIYTLHYVDRVGCFRSCKTVTAQKDKQMKWEIRMFGPSSVDETIQQKSSGSSICNISTWNWMAASELAFPSRSCRFIKVISTSLDYRANLKTFHEWAVFFFACSTVEGRYMRSVLNSLEWVSWLVCASLLRASTVWPYCLLFSLFLSLVVS